MKILIHIQEWVAEFPLSESGIQLAKLWLDTIEKITLGE